MQGMAVVGYAVIAGFGLTALSGISFSPLAGSVVPFLALGLGELEILTQNFVHKEPQISVTAGSIEMFSDCERSDVGTLILSYNVCRYR